MQVEGSAHSGSSPPGDPGSPGPSSLPPLLRPPGPPGPPSLWAAPRQQALHLPRDWDPARPWHGKLQTTGQGTEKR